MGSGGLGAGEVRPWEAMHFIVLKLGLSFSLWIKDRGWLVLVPGCTAAALPWYFG